MLITRSSNYITEIIFKLHVKYIYNGNEMSHKLTIIRHHIIINLDTELSIVDKG